LIQQAIAQVLTPLFDPSFSDSSFGFRPGRSAHDAVYQVRDVIRKGFRIAVDLDLSKLFDTVDHDVLMHRVALKVRDKRVLRLIGKYPRAGVLVDGQKKPLGGFLRAAHFRSCCPTSSWTTWIKSLRDEVTTSPGTPTTSLSW
jgi:RNA-directed DNA polymerase